MLINRKNAMKIFMILDAKKYSLFFIPCSGGCFEGQGVAMASPPIFFYIICNLENFNIFKNFLNYM